MAERYPPAQYRPSVDWVELVEPVEQRRERQVQRSVDDPVGALRGVADVEDLQRRVVASPRLEL